MKKLKLRQWVKDAIAVAALYLFIIGSVFVLMNRVEELNNLEQTKTDCTIICNQ